MSNDYMMSEETVAYAKQVYTQMHGFYKEGTVPGVQDELEGGAVGKYYEEMYNALERLGERCGFDMDDEDREDMLNALEDLLLESGIKMFEYGMKYAQGKL